MEKYEILLIVLAISIFSVAFQVLIEELTINKVLNVKRIAINFSSKNILLYIFNSKLKQIFLSYYNYQLEQLTCKKTGIIKRREQWLDIYMNQTKIDKWEDFCKQLKGFQL